MQYPDVESSPAYQLWLVTNAWQRRARHSLEPFNLTHVQFVILACIDLLHQQKGAPTQAEVCRFADLDENMTSQVLRGLEQRGLVVRDKHPTDGRAHLLALTPAGRTLRDQAKQVVRAASEKFFAPLGEDVTALTGLLRRLNEAQQP
jgi:DNA-binding MarR family transcriptional regulator